MTAWEQDPITMWRRDLAAEDEARIRVEHALAEVLRCVRIRIAWAARALRRG